MRKSLLAPLAIAIIIAAAILIVRTAASDAIPDPTLQHALGARVIDIAVLVFREGLECILVLAALTVTMRGANQAQQRPVVLGGAAALLAGVATWFVAVRIIDSLSESLPALHVQAATGLLAIIVLLVVMNWFFHKVYWTGWISLHTRKRQSLVSAASESKMWWGLALLGFSSVYRESFEIVLFLQSYRLKLGTAPVALGLSAGLVLTAAIGAITFVAHKKLPYRRMLVATGILLGAVLLVMVGEQAQEMQLAGWLGTTPVAWLPAPAWLQLWFAVFPTVETLSAQTIALTLVLGSYWAAHQPAAPSADRQVVPAEGSPYQSRGIRTPG